MLSRPVRWMQFQKSGKASSNRKVNMPEEPSNEVMMVRFCVPTLGTKIQLAKDWKFKLFNEYRNDSLWGIISGKEYVRNWRDEPATPIPVTFPKGTVLSIDRIYVRRGKTDYDSLTFNLISTSHEKLQKKKGRIRFWAKLADVNAIECYPIGSPTQKIEDSVFSSYVVLGGLGKRLLVV